MKKKLLSVVLCVALMLSCVCITAFAADTAEAKIGDTEYATLALAVDAANANEGEDVIELLTDVIVDTTLKINDVTVINGNGNTVTTNGAKKSFEVYAYCQQP